MDGILVGFEMYQGVGKDDMIAKLQGATRFQYLCSYGQRQFQAWSINAVLLFVESSCIIQDNKMISIELKLYHFHRAES